MAEKIVVVTTGGTIGSVISGSALSVDPNGTGIVEEIGRLCQRRNINVEVIQALNKHSEDLTPSDWFKILRIIDAHMKQGTSKFVITHGTDTLAYTAAAVGLSFGNADVKICLTGSFEPLELPGSDGPLNLIAAFRAVLSDETPNGVYVAFRTSQKNTQAAIIPALDLKPMGFDDQAFQSMYDKRVALYGSKSGYVLSDDGNLSTSPISLEFRDASEEAIAKALEKLDLIVAYPGMSLERFIGTSVKAIVLSLYHCGTAAAIHQPGSVTDFLERVNDEISIFGSAYSSNYIKIPYESTGRLIMAGANIYRDIQAHVIFAYLLLGLSQEKAINELKENLDAFKYKAPA